MTLLKTYFSRKQDGNMNSHRASDLNDAEVIKNRNIFFMRHGTEPRKVVSMKPAHGNNVVVVENTNQLYIQKTDALITREKDISLSVTFADCYPIVLWDEENNICALMSCGWKSIVAGIVQNTLRKMHEMGCSQSLKAMIGPGLCPKCFEFDYDEFLALDLQKVFMHKSELADPTKVEMSMIATVLGLLSGKVDSFNVDYSHTSCTKEDSNLFSHRGGDHDEAMKPMANVAVVEMSSWDVMP